MHAGYGPFRALFGVSFAGVRGQRHRPPRPQRLREDDRRPGRLGPGEPDGRLVLLVDGKTSPASRLAVARLGVIHAPEGRSVFSTLTVEENLVLASGASWASARRRRPGPVLRAVPSPRRTPNPGGRARSRAASSGCCRWPGSWPTRPGCSSPTSSRSAWPRSSSTRCTARWDDPQRRHVVAHRRAARPPGVDPGRPRRAPPEGQRGGGRPRRRDPRQGRRAPPRRALSRLAAGPCPSGRGATCVTSRRCAGSSLARRVADVTRHPTRRRSRTRRGGGR